MIDRIAIWPSTGSVGMVDADAGVRSGIPPVEGFGCTSIRTDAVPSFPRASSTVTLARLGPASEYEWLARGDACSRVRLPSPKSNSRSEEHTSELQSRLHLVCRLLLEKKKK